MKTEEFSKHIVISLNLIISTLHMNTNNVFYEKYIFLNEKKLVR